MTSIQGIDDEKIGSYLEKHGITPMQNRASQKRKPPQCKRRRLDNNKQIQTKLKHNEHLSDVLEYYDENTLAKRNQ